MIEQPELDARCAGDIQAGERLAGLD